MRTRIGAITFNWQAPFLPEAVKTLAEIGYEGFEVGTQMSVWEPYRKEPRRFKEVLVANPEIELTGMYYGADFYISERCKEDIKGGIDVAETVAMLGSKYLIVGFGPRKPDAFGLTNEEFRRIAHALNEIAKACQDLGITCCAHPHINQTIERRHEIAKLFSYVDTTIVKMCIDTGHLYAGGADPVEIINEYASLIKYVHLKDYSDGYYCPLGTGEMDNEAILDALRAIGYSGWLIPEVPARGSCPKENAQLNYSFLVDRLW